jgi:predicted phosphatase
MKRKLQEMTAESLSLATAQTMKPKTVEKFFNILEKVATKNKISVTPGNIFHLDKNDVHVNNKPDSTITEKLSKKIIF